MDVYTTSFCLPHKAAHHDIEENVSPSFELPRDVVAAAAAAGSNNNHVYPNQHHHQTQTQTHATAAPPRSSTRQHHQPSRSVSSYSRPASIPEDREEADNGGGGGEGGDLSNNAGHGTVAENNATTGTGNTTSSSTTAPGISSANLTSRRSNLSIVSLGHQQTTGGDNASTAPSSQIGGHSNNNSGSGTNLNLFSSSSSSAVSANTSNVSTGVASIPSLKQVSSSSRTVPGSSEQPHQQQQHQQSPSSENNAVLMAVQQRANTEITEAIQKLCMEAMSNYQCMVTSTPLDNSNPIKGYNFILSGGYQQVMAARGFIFRATPFKTKSIVKVPRSEVLDSKELVKVEMKKKLDEIAILTKSHLAIVGQVSGTIGFGLETERNVEIVITGTYESVEQARVRLLVLLDELSGLHSDVCEIDYKLHNIISGRKRGVIQTIQEETATNIYFPTPLTGIISPRDPTLLSKQNLIFITGEFFGVQRARDMLFQVSMHKSKCIISRDTAMLPRKLDWLLSDKLEDVKNIMIDNGTFINFPMVGSQASLISVYGDHRVNIERTLRAIMQLATQFYVSQFWLLPMNFDVFMPPPTINPSQVPAILKLISAATGAEVVFKSNCFEYHGLETEIRTAVQLVLELDIVKAFHHEIRFQIELANEHRDFISGKKNGKLNKIMKTAGVKIKFETFNDYNFLIDIAGNDTGALHGLSLLQEELPAEMSFHVPEIYHKRIIGVGGKNIQRIMKKYGVYVKFSNAEEFASLGGYLENEDNVIARTPAKNNAALDQLKAAVMEMVIPKDKDYVVETVSIPRRYHRTLLGEKSIFIHDIESKTNSNVRFPNKETAADIVSIFGPESQVHIAAQMLLDHVPFEAEYRMPHSEQMSQLALAQNFLDLQDKIKRDLNITILPWVDRSGGGDETVIRFLLNRSNQHFLTTARDTVEEFLLAQEIPLYPGSLRPRNDSFATSFPFFNSKLLSTLGDNETSGQTANGGGAGLTSNSGPDQGRNFSLHPTASASDIKAIFDGPQVPVPQAYNYMPIEPSVLANPVEPSPYYTHQVPQQPQSASPAVPEYQPLHTPRFYAQGVPMSANAYTGSTAFVPSHPNRLSEEMAVPPSQQGTKRESDPLMDDKLKELVRRGALGHHLNARAQSLDISQQTKTFGRGASTVDTEAVGNALSNLRL